MEGLKLNQNDLRVIKTKKNIELSFILLLNEKGFYKITIQDILDAALINRTTFYKHYADKYQLAETLCNKIFNLLQSSVKDRFHYANTKDMLLAVKTLYQNLSSKSTEILALFTIHTDSIHLYDDMYYFLKKSFEEQPCIGNQHCSDISDYLSAVYASFVMTSIKWCLENNGYDQLVEHTSFFLELAETFNCSSHK